MLESVKLENKFTASDDGIKEVKKDVNKVSIG